jgi:hypothetical protein
MSQPHGTKNESKRLSNKESDWKHVGAGETLPTRTRHGGKRKERVIESSSSSSDG